MDNTVIDGPELLSLGTSLVIVIGVVVVLGWLYSRMRVGSSGASSTINVLASRALGARERLVLVKVGGQTLLIGMTPGQVSTLHTFDGEVAVGRAPEGMSGFADRLRAVLRGAGK